MQVLRQRQSQFEKNSSLPSSSRRNEPGANVMPPGMAARLASHALRHRVSQPEQIPDTTYPAQEFPKLNTSLNRAVSLQASTAAESLTSQPQADQVRRQLGGGRALEHSVSSWASHSLRHDLSDVEVHPDNNLTQKLGAKAITVGNHVAFAPGQYRPGTRDGDHLIAHELTHVVQQTGAPDRIQAFSGRGDDYEVEAEHAADEMLAGDSVTRISPLNGIGLQRWPPEPAECRAPEPEFESSPAECRAPESEFESSPPVCEMPASESNTSFISGEGGEALNNLGGPGQLTIPVNVTFSMSEEDAREFGWEASIARSTAIGTTRGFGNIISPPIRGFSDPFLPLSTRLGEGMGPLGELGGTYGAERYVSSEIMRDLRPRIFTEASELALRDITGGSEWLTRYGLSGRDLEQMPGLITRMSEGGTLSTAETAMLQTFFRAHAEHGLTFASPAMSATTQSGLSTMSNVAPFIRERPYVVRIEIPSSSVGEVNAVLGTNRPANLVQELEVLVFTDARGNVTNIRPNPTSTLGSAAPYLRWGGRALIVVGVGVSTYRIANATPEERPRVIGEEGGGWLGGLGGAALVTAGCVALGVPTGGIVLFLCGLGGGLLGGFGGSYLGGEAGEAMGPNPIGRAASWAVDTYTESMMRSPDRVVRQDAVAIRRVVYQDDSFSMMYLMNRMCGGCLNFGF